MKLPASLDGLSGLRAARWIRESTSGQFDAFGPDAQREQQDRAIERYRLADTGLAWQVAHSGRTVGDTEQFREMLGRAGRDYDVLVVGYVSRFARDLRTAVNARHDLHAAGAAILFADEALLTSYEDKWNEWARHAVEAESYSRDLGKRIREGYAAKRRRLGEPGGRPPLGYVRAGRPPQLRPDAGRMVQVRSAFERSAACVTDRAIARELHLPLDTVRGILTNPIYIGQLRDGSPASVAPVIDQATWDRVHALRAARNARGGIAARNRTYALPMLRCADCGRRLIGDTGRYRHLDPCEGFVKARRRRAWKNQLTRRPGHSYAQGFYEGFIAPVLREVRYELDATDLTRASEHYAAMAPAPDELALRRVESARERSLGAYRSHRDAARLEADMARLDAEERRLREVPNEMPAWREVLALLRDVPALWDNGTSEERRKMAEALFESIDAKGARSMTVNFRVGIQAVVGVGARGLEPTVTITRTPWAEAEVSA